MTGRAIAELFARHPQLLVAICLVLAAVGVWALAGALAPF
jgi:hypothetical protein